jgi:hypothetical protein
MTWGSKCWVDRFGAGVVRVTLRFRWIKVPAATQNVGMAVDHVDELNRSTRLWRTATLARWPSRVTACQIAADATGLPMPDVEACLEMLAARYVVRLVHGGLTAIPLRQTLQVDRG